MARTDPANLPPKGDTMLDPTNDQGVPARTPQIQTDTKPTDPQILARAPRVIESNDRLRSDLLSTREAASYLTISVRKLWSLTNCGGIPTVRIGKAVRISRAALDAYIKSHTRRGRAEL